MTYEERGQRRLPASRCRVTVITVATLAINHHLRHNADQMGALDL
jgi:hypothetical protein